MLLSPMIPIRIKNLAAGDVVFYNESDHSSFEIVKPFLILENNVGANMMIDSKVTEIYDNNANQGNYTNLDENVWCLPGFFSNSFVEKIRKELPLNIKVFKKDVLVAEIPLSMLMSNL